MLHDITQYHVELIRRKTNVKASLNTRFAWNTECCGMLFSCCVGRKVTLDTCIKSFAAWVSFGIISV